jgi:hypothetical protein
MLYYIKFYTKYIFFSLTLLILCVIFYQISTFRNEVTFTIGDYKIFTKQNVLIFLFMGFYYIVFKVFKFLIFINYYIISIKYTFLDKLEILKSYLSRKQKSEYALINEILDLKRKRLYRQALKLTSENFTLSGKILFWHLFFLLKLGKRNEFLRLFSNHPSGLSIRLFKVGYLNKKLPFLRGFFLRNLYHSNLDSQVITYIYADYLFHKGNVKKAGEILTNFLKHKKILMSDIYCSYLMNMLAIKIERNISGEMAEDFILDYKENIETYNESKKK